MYYELWYLEGKTRRLNELNEQFRSSQDDKTVWRIQNATFEINKLKKTGFHLLKIFVLLQKCALTVAKDITSYKKCVIFKNV